MIIDQIEISDDVIGKIHYFEERFVNQLGRPEELESTYEVCSVLRCQLYYQQ